MTPGIQGRPTTGEGALVYSKAFERLAGDDPEDIVNRLAYALYKMGIWEAVASGNSPTPRPNRDPSPTEVSVYREAALQRLQVLAADAIEEAAPSLKESGITQAIATSRGEIIATVNAKTHWFSGLVVNICAWIVTLFLTCLIVQTYALPSVIDAVNKALRNEGPRLETAPAGPR